MLQIAARILCPLKSESLRAEKSNTLRFHFAQTSRGPRTILLDVFEGVAEDHVGDFVEQRSVRHRRERRDGYLLASREAPYVAVDVVEGNLLDAQHLQRPGAVPAR